MYFVDIRYLYFALPGLILTMIASALTKSTFSKYSRIRASSGLTGAQAAQQLLTSQGIGNVAVKATRGMLTDHYNPMDRSLNLSEAVYASNSLAAIGVACHEAGHALQHANAYSPLKLRSALVPVVKFGSSFSYIVIMLGYILRAPMFINLGIGLFSLAVIFSLITLPVEWNASARAKRLMVSSGIVSYDEQNAAGKVLNAAFLTYVASVITSLMTLLYYISRRR